jgi:CO/xanthine dehydrogenase FAD-binding subunit
MIIEYHRPESMSEALELLAREEPLTVPLGGGTVLSRARKPDIAVVDVRRLGLDSITREGQMLKIGAATTLQQLVDCEDTPQLLRESILREAQVNLRQMVTVAGTLVSCDGRSPFVTALLALDPRLQFAGDDSGLPLGDFLPLRRSVQRSRLILGIEFALNTELQFEMVARSPMDRPVVCAAVTSWPSGRTRVTLGGWGDAPILAMDGPEAGGAVAAARGAFRSAGDEWASASYRMDVVGKLVQRILKSR